MTKEELRTFLAPIMSEILDKLGDLEDKVDTMLSANQRDFLKVSEVADQCGVSPQAVHWHLSHNPNLEPDKDYFKRKGKYFLTQGAANRLIKEIAKNG